MNIRFSAFAIVALLLAGIARAAAGENFLLETRVFVFRHTDVGTVKVAGAEGIEKLRGAVIRPPASIQFGPETLSLTGAQFAWSGGRNAPQRFSAVDTPNVVLAPGQSASFVTSVPVQYVEKADADTLKLREIAANSPDAPHCRLTFTINRTNDAAFALQMTCDLDVATVTGRENLSGVTLDIGRPTLARFADKLEAKVRPQEWSALLLQSPNGSDYSLLLLFKIGSAPMVGSTMKAPPAKAASPGGLMQPEEIDKFATHYYLHPRPDEIARVIDSISATGFLDDRFEIFAGFFMEVFAANPDRVAEWQRLMKRSPATADLLERMQKPLVPEGLIKGPVHSVAANDRHWGAFFASGNPFHLQALVGEMKMVDQYWRDWFWAGATAKWSLARNYSEHPLVRSTLEAMQPNMDARTQELIAEVLKQDLPAIRQEIVATLTKRTFRDGYASSSTNPFGITSLTSGNVGASAGMPPPDWPGASLDRR